MDDVRQALYREAQLALRDVAGARELDTFLMEEDGVANDRVFEVTTALCLADARPPRSVASACACQDAGHGADCREHPRREEISMIRHALRLFPNPVRDRP